MYSKHKYLSNRFAYYDCNMKTLANRVKSRRIEMGMSQGQLAAAAKISQSTVAQIEGGRNRGSKYLVQLAAALNVSPEWLDDGSGDVGSPRVVFDGSSEADEIGDLAAPSRAVQVTGEVMGGPSGFLDQETLVAEEIYLLTYSKDPLAYGLRLRGDSMRPRFKPGEFLLVEPSIDVLPGDDVVISLHDGRKMLKELVISRDDDVEVTSVNNGDRFTLDRTDIQSIHRIGGHFVRYSSFVVRR